MPTKTDIIFYYDCPKCGAEHQKSLMEAQHNRCIQCFCGYTIWTELLENHGLSLNWGESVDKPPAKCYDRPIEIEQALSNMGFTKKDIAGLIEGVDFTKGVDEILKEILRKVR